MCLSLNYFYSQTIPIYVGQLRLLRCLDLQGLIKVTAVVNELLPKALKPTSHTLDSSLIITHLTFPLVIYFSCVSLLTGYDSASCAHETCYGFVCGGLGPVTGFYYAWSAHVSGFGETASPCPGPCLYLYLFLDLCLYLSPDLCPCLSPGLYPDPYPDFCCICWLHSSCCPSCPRRNGSPHAHCVSSPLWPLSSPAAHSTQHAITNLQHHWTPYTQQLRYLPPTL